ncbi:hypothetical protein OW763_12175 [Clostridium aestuarii]|uniref:Uncharacterized protein n=1 Tax=Clostridium aestuarii TaxID=338193 RepID=A0ABT4D1H2_9CLOT|nr:hypothetical protein [Clostridium aestuarii]MCY6485096.1 hypothetical protein [Clostridium aestuarii]
MKDENSNLTDIEFIMRKICAFIKVDEFSYDKVDNYTNNALNEIKIKENTIKINKQENINLKESIELNKEKLDYIKKSVRDTECKLNMEKNKIRELKNILRILMSRKKVDKLKMIVIPKYIKIIKKYGDIKNIQNQIYDHSLKREDLVNEIYDLFSQKKRVDNKINKSNKIIGKLNKDCIHKEKEIKSIKGRLKILNQYMKQLYDESSKKN